MRGPSSNNAVPFVMGHALAPDAGVEVLGFTDVESGPLAWGAFPAEDVDARTRLVVQPNGVALEVVGGAAHALPRNDRRR